MHTPSNTHTIPAIRLSILSGILLMLLVTQGMAMYEFEGLPFRTAGQGEVTGDVVVFGSYGLRDPPVTTEFSLTGEVQWARTYVGVWGGTPRYTGWVQTTFNGQPFEKITLYGQDDKTPNVFCSGYGVYWVAYDTTTLCRQGSNTVTATTSKGEAANKLDGRIYTVVTVVVIKNPDGENTQYWILEGNQNLHGEGWSGTNPTSHEEAGVSIPLSDTSSVRAADLTVLYLTSSRGQPDYLKFNGQDLGKVVSGPNYPEGARDIANERSFDAGSLLNPTDGRYCDMEVFDVTKLIKTGQNDVTFFRGRDLDGDGIIIETGEKPEGEDYLHPVLVMLALKKSRPEATSPDLSIRTIDMINAYEGVSGTILVTLENLGTIPSSPAELKVSVDGTSISTQPVTIAKSGIQEISVPWQTAPGSHTVRVEISHGEDSVPGNNVLEKHVTIGTLPDLAISMGPPSRPGSGASTEKTPLPFPVVLISLGLAAAILAVFQHRRPPGRQVIMRMGAIACITLIISAGTGTIPVPASADSSTSLYLLPVTVKNVGGSDAQTFFLVIYLDGEKIATKSYEGGIRAGDEIHADIPLHTSSGSHLVKVIADEEQKIRDANRGNNVMETSYVFP